MSAPALFTKRLSRFLKTTSGVLLAASFLHGAVLAGSKITLSSNVDQANAGFYTLSWQSIKSDPHEFRLEESADAEFSQIRTLYQGADKAYAMSGKHNGDYYYRVADVTSSSPVADWSQPVKVTVAHHSLLRAFSFFAAGAIIFMATLILIVHGACSTRTLKDT